MTATDVARARRLTKAQARKLTDRIASTAGELWSLIAEAHDGEAWRALGYDTWAAYVDAEFAISRGQAFRLLDQARVAGALEQAVGEPVTVSARQAAVLRDDPDRHAKRAARAIAKGTDPDIAVAREVARVRSARTSKQERATEGGDPTGSPTPPRASGGAAATAEKVAEAPTAASKPARSSIPPSGADQGPSAPAPSSGAAPATPEGVRRMVAMVTTTGADTIAHCCEARAIAAALDTLTAAFKRKAPKAAGTPAPAARSAANGKRDVQPRLKGMK